MFKLANKKNLRSKTLGSKRGLTLLEILMVIALLGLVFTFIGKNIFSKFGSGKEKIARIFLSDVKGALDHYKLDCNDYPKSLQALIQNPGDCPAYATEGYWSKKQFKDPYGCDVSYTYDGGQITLKSLGQGCQEGGDGAATDIVFEE